MLHISRETRNMSQFHYPARAGQVVRLKGSEETGEEIRPSGLNSIIPPGRDKSVRLKAKKNKHNIKLYQKVFEVALATKIPIGASRIGTIPLWFD